MVNKITSYQTAENGKFVEIVGNTEYPAISVVRWSYPDTSDAFPENSGLPPVSSVDVYSKYAVLTHLTNPEDIKISLSAENINISLDDIEFLLSATNVYLDALTAINYNKQNDIITRLDSLTSTNIEVPGFSIPPYDEISLNYYGSTNNIRTVLYKNNTTPVLSLSFGYITNPPTLNDTLLSSVKKI